MKRLKLMILTVELTVLKVNGALLNALLTVLKNKEVTNND